MLIMTNVWGNKMSNLILGIVVIYSVIISAICVSDSVYRNKDYKKH